MVFDPIIWAATLEWLDMLWRTALIAGLAGAAYNLIAWLRDE